MPTTTAQPDSQLANLLDPTDSFIRRHIGPSEADIKDMLALLGCKSLDQLSDETVPESIRLRRPLGIGKPRTEHDLLKQLKQIAGMNQVYRSFIGMGYHGCITPGVILRNILENPCWYTQYTPYQAEISQGRLEALINFQTMVSDLTALPLANASLLDEATAGAEAMAMCHATASDKPRFLVSSDCHPQTIAVMQTRAKSMGIELVVVEESQIASSLQDVSGVLVQYPATDGRIGDPRSYAQLAQRVHEAGALFVVAADILALALLVPPGEFGADIAVGSTQRFGVPMGFGGPHAAYLATRNEFARRMPGRLVGVSRDAHGNKAYRLAIQTREQHIKRDRATSNICTAQVLLAIMASMYAVYHGPKGLRDIARRVHGLTKVLARGLKKLGHPVAHAVYFDTLDVHAYGDAHAVVDAALARGINLCRYGEPGEYGHDRFGVSLDETATLEDVSLILQSVVDAYPEVGPVPPIQELVAEAESDILGAFTRTSEYLTHPVFNRYHCETEMLRYINRLQARDISLAQAMIPLGSCTMKLNATTEMIPITWPEFANLHPFVPAEQAKGYHRLFNDLEDWLCRVTGFEAVSLQPNAGSQGEYAGLLAIRGYHESRGESHRNVCLIPVSAHGTNPASAVIAGFHVVPVNCDSSGNIEVNDLKTKAKQHTDNLACLMITYPSTHGVFEEDVKEICQVIHEHGGQVYMDGANMNAQVGLCRPGDIGADVCHLNLHKTFCIPHGGGGPGMGPIGVAKHLTPFLPAHPLSQNEKGTVGPVSAAPHGSAAILPISWVYIALMGDEGLTKATQVAILNANYMARRLEEHYPILFKGRNGRVAHEFVMDCRQFKVSAAVEVEDIAKRLMDYGFHAPTMSWPVPGTLMIEPTESESRFELDRLVDALICIREEIKQIEWGKADLKQNVLKNAPHTAAAVTSDSWTRPYPREQAAFPTAFVRDHKFWPPVGRIDNPYGDRNLVCTCPPMDSAQE